MNDIQPTSTLPQIVQMLEVKDHGPCDEGATAVCPHCGADGRYVYRFRCADGTVRGAMSGCLQLFPKHRLALEMEKIFRKSVGTKPKPLNRWDERIKAATEDWLNGKTDEATAIRLVNNAVQERKRWVQQRYGH